MNTDNKYIEKITEINTLLHFVENNILDELLQERYIKVLRFHDLRHEAVSRFFEMGLSVPEVALISGHKDVRQLFRYTHLKPENLIAKYSNIF